MQLMLHVMLCVRQVVENVDISHEQKKLAIFLHQNKLEYCDTNICRYLRICQNAIQKKTFI
jgi:hypothetical protein